MEDTKLFYALVSGVAKREYEGDESITPEFLKEAVFASSSETVQDIERACGVCREVLARAAYEDYEASQLESFLKLKKTDLSQLQKDTIVRFWRNQRAKIHEAVKQRCTWDGTLQKMAWRMDVKTRTRSQPDINEPVAIVELHINKFPEGKDVARFEMDREQLSHVLAQVEDLEREIERVAGPQQQQQQQAPASRKSEQ
eukprot:m51a1_g6367 putative comm domain-containing protein 1 (199) ;mRNA; r:119569-120427